MKCKEKQVYITKAYAKKVKKIAEREHHRKLTVYKCQECGLYHFFSGGVNKIQYYRNRVRNHLL